jgi:hypothetical protein
MNARALFWASPGKAFFLCLSIGTEAIGRSPALASGPFWNRVSNIQISIFKWRLNDVTAKKSNQTPAPVYIDAIGIECNDGLAPIGGSRH